MGVGGEELPCLVVRPAAPADLLPVPVLSAGSRTRKAVALTFDDGWDAANTARIVATLDEALEGMTHLCATAMTPRDFGPPTVAPRAHFDALLKAPDARQTGVAFLFGSERFGMANDDVYRCHACLSIPSNPKFGSLNLAAALQVIAYDWREALGGYPVQAATAEPMLADAAQVAGMLAHLEQALTSIGFLDPQSPKKLMPRLNQLFNRAAVTQEEIHILRGIAKMMMKQPWRTE